MQQLGDFSVGDVHIAEKYSLAALVWYGMARALVRSAIPGNYWRRTLLRCFGADIGNRVVLKPGISIKYPWKLRIGNDSWIGEDTVIDNIVMVDIGNNTCVSQSVRICTGSHDYADVRFAYRHREIVISDHVWVCMGCIICPGAHLERGAVVLPGSVAAGRLKEMVVYRGNLATPVRERVMKNDQKGE